MLIYSEVDTRSILCDLMSTREEYVKHFSEIENELQTSVIGRERVRFMKRTQTQTQYVAPQGFYCAFIQFGAKEPSVDDDSNIVAISPVRYGWSVLQLDPLSSMYETLRDMLYVDRKIQDSSKQYLSTLERTAAAIKDDLESFKSGGYEILGFCIPTEALQFLSRNAQAEDRGTLDGLTAGLKEASKKYDDYVKMKNSETAVEDIRVQTTDALKEAQWIMDKGESNVDTDQET